MSVFLWILQILLGLHTALGAAWKLVNSELSVPSLSAIPHPVWLAMSGFEALCAVGLLLPVLHRPVGFLAPVAAVLIAGEMVLMSAVHLASGDPDLGPMIYWLVVAGISAFLAYARWVLQPIT